MKLRNTLIWIAMVAAVIGLIASIYSVKTHYAPAGDSFCSINETFDCDIVNKSKYSEFLGIPVSVLGVLGYVFLLVSLAVYRVKREQRILDAIVIVAAIGLAFSLYLTYVEAFVLYTWCLVCLGSQAAMLTVFGTTGWLRYLDRIPEPFTHE